MEPSFRWDGALDEDTQRDPWIAAEYARRLADGDRDPAAVYVEVVAAWEAGEGEAVPARRRRRRSSSHAAAPRPARAHEPGGLAALTGDRLPATLLEAAGRAVPGRDPVEDVAHARMLTGLRDALGRAVRATAGDGDLFGGALAANDQRRRDEAARPTAPVTPEAAYAGLAAQVAVAAVQRSLTTAPARLAARVVDGGEPLRRLDDRPDLLTALAAAAADPGEPLAAPLRAQLERELGHRFGHVRVHAGAAAAEAARAIGARAFTLGAHVYVGDGELAPGTEAGLALLRHELTHVIQYDQGRLQGDGGLAVTDHDGPEEREARAAETARPAAASAPAPAPGPAPRAEPAAPAPAKGVVAPGLLDRARSAVGGAIGDLASLGEDAFLSVVRRISPQLADLIERGPEALVGDGVRDAVGAMLRSLIPDNPLAPLVAFGAGILDVAGTLVGAAAGDNKCCETFATWCTKLGAFARKAASSEAVKTFKAAFAALDSALGLVVRVFGFGLTEALRGHLQFLTTMGGWITDAIAAVARVAQRIADWVLTQLGWPSVAEIGVKLQALAERAWQAIKDLAKDAVAKLREVAPVLLTISGLGPVVAAFQFSLELIEVTDWLIAHRNDPNLVRNAREQMAHTFLPRLLEKMGGLVGKIQAAVAWVEGHLAEVIAVLAGVALVLTGVLAPLGLAVLGAVAVLRQVWPTLKPAFAQLEKTLAELWQKFLTFSNPVIDTFVQLGTLISQPWMLPSMLAGSAWLLLPECFKGPIVDLILELLIAAIDVMPESVALFGPLWRYMKAGALGFLREVRAQWTQPDKVTVVNRIARMASGRSLQMMTGFVVGFGKGVIAGVLDPFKMIYDLLKIGWDLTVWLAKLVNHSPEVAAAIQRHLPQLQQQAQHIMDAGRQALDDFLAGKITFEDVWKLMTSFADSLEAQATQLGVTGAQRIKGWILGADTEYSIGEALGIAIGFIIVFALIVYFSGGAFAEAKGVIGVVAQIARVLNAPYELLGAALKPLATAFGPVLRALAAFGERLGLKAVWEGALGAFERFVQTLGRLVEDILIAIERRVVERSAEVIASELARRFGAELGGRLVQELGAAGAERLVDRLGEDLVRRLGNDLSAVVLDQLATKLTRPVIERMVSRGLTPRAIERLGTALEREAIEQLLDRGLTAAQLERLGGLAAGRLEGLSVDQLARVAALEPGAFARLNALSDEGFRRMATLSDAGLRRFLALADDRLIVFASMEEAAFNRFAALGDQPFARFAAMEVGELQKFASLSEGAFNRFAALEPAVFEKFRALTPEALERFGALAEPAFARFAALDATAIAKFENVSADALARYGAMPAGFDRFAALSREGVEKFAGLTDGAFDRFARLADDAFLKFEALEREALERFGTLTEPAFNRFAALDGASIAKFADVEAAALERYGQLGDDALRRFAALDAPGIERFAALTDAAFAKYAGITYTPAQLANLARVDAAALENLAQITRVDHFNVVTRRISEGGLNNLGQLTGPQLDQLLGITGTNAALIETAGSLTGATLRELITLPQPIALKYLRLTGAELRGFEGLTAAELDRLGGLAPDALARFGAVGDVAAMQRFAALTPAQLGHFAPLSTAQLRVWGAVQPGTLAHFAPMEGALANLADAVPAAVLDRFATELAPTFMREVALVDAAGIRRLGNLPPADLAKLEGLSGFDLQRATQLPPGELERISAGSRADAQAALTGDAAAARREAEALDGPPGAHTGHGHADHGAQTTVAEQERRLNSGTTPSGRTHDPLGNPLQAPPEAGRWASDAVQVHASQMAEAHLPNHIATNGPSTHPRGRYQFEMELHGAGYSYRLEAGAGTPAIERQANRFLIVYEPRIQPPPIPPSTNPADYVIITMYPI